MSALPAVIDDEYGVAVVDRSSGEMVALADASDHAIASAAAELAAHDRHIFALKRALASEMRQRHGVGAASAGGYGFTVAESQSWPINATFDALENLATRGIITAAEITRCMPVKPKPDPRQIKALIGRLTVSDPASAKQLADACSLSPPSLRDIKALAVDEADEAA